MGDNGMIAQNERFETVFAVDDKRCAVGNHIVAVKRLIIFPYVRYSAFRQGRIDIHDTVSIPENFRAPHTAIGTAFN